MIRAQLSYLLKIKSIEAAVSRASSARFLYPMKSSRSHYHITTTKHLIDLKGKMNKPLGSEREHGIHDLQGYDIDKAETRSHAWIKHPKCCQCMLTVPVSGDGEDLP
jgi:hypothetical protein